VAAAGHPRDRSGMTRSAVAISSIFVLALLSACSTDAAPHAIGAYQLDKEALKHISVTGMAIDEAIALRSTVESTVELRADGTMSVGLKMPPKRLDASYSGTWRLEGDKLSVTAKGADGKDATRVVDYKDGAFTLQTEGPIQMALTYRKM
jgi:hypothetical protein